MERLAEQSLLNWKNQPNSKPLIIRGARQVGKTYLLKQFGANHFPSVHYINFEKESHLAQIFAQNLEPKRIISELSLHLENNINLATDLLIFDEIQACPNALTSLKYFAEELPELSLCAAGSLLGLHLNQGSFPVGKVEMLELYPMSFYEFLLGTEQHQLADYYKNINIDTEESSIAHEKLWQQLKYYFIVGGLPEPVSIFHEKKEQLYLAFEAVRKKQQSLINDYFADMAKHAGKVNALHIDRVWRSIPSQLARSQDGQSTRFRFKGVVPGIDRYSRLAHVFDWLEKAGLIIRVPIIDKPNIPLAAYSEESVFKCYLFDTGLLGAMSQLDPRSILAYDYGSYKGYFAENFAAQALTASLQQTLYCWQHQRAEVEFLVQHGSAIIPIEVKAGHITRSKSLQQYCEKYQPAYRVILSGNPLNVNLTERVRKVPLYLAGVLDGSD